MVPTVEKIGRYEIVSELGRGAMGLVYRAIDPNIGRTVALKTMRLDVHGMEHDDMLRRFKNEARAAGLMNHPNIVTIYDADEADGLFYIAMEYMEGQTVQSLVMEKRVLPAEQIVEIGIQVCAGLDYAHQMKVIHRDIKPANIMITRPNVAKIMDFGISKAVGSMTSSSQVLGTPNYMAPEQIKGLDLDGRADVFSFGVVLYEMATGERPFIGQNVTTIIYKIVNENPIPPSELEVTVHPGLSAVIARCLSKNPQERYGSAADLAHDLANYRSIASDGDITAVIPGAEATQAAANSTGAWRNGHSAASAESQPALRTGTIRRQTIKQTTGVMRRAAGRAGARKREKMAVAATLVALAIVLAAASFYRIKHRPQHVLAAPVAQVPAPPPPPVPQATTELQSKTDSSKPIPKKTTHAEVRDEEKDKPKSASGKVQIKFRSRPEGAFVQIDGKSSEAWLTPFTMPDVTPGTHELVFTKVGYTSETRTVEVGPRSSTYRVDLVPVTTAVALSSDPPGADIEIDGKDTTRMTPAQIPVGAGEHKIVLRLDGYREQQVIANVKKGEIFQFHPVLNPGDVAQAGNASRLGKLFNGGFRSNKGIVDFVTTPPGARIFIRGRPSPIATPAHAALLPGEYAIELHEQGYKTARRTVQVEPGQTIKLEVTLEPQ
ncbi:MAG TPA: serine/threonine-protein kinase [Terriglobales bacterium]|nr:serine/threonine-protein kinase [Terriglobales bacterium]